MIKHLEAKQGFFLLPKRWVVERSFAQVSIPDAGTMCLTYGPHVSDALPKTTSADTFKGLHFLGASPIRYRPPGQHNRVVIPQTVFGLHLQGYRRTRVS